jgi:hypothetical protein
MYVRTYVFIHTYHIHTDHTDHTSTPVAGRCTYMGLHQQRMSPSRCLTWVRYDECVAGPVSVCMSTCVVCLDSWNGDTAAEYERMRSHGFIFMGVRHA